MVRAIFIVSLAILADGIVLHLEVIQVEIEAGETIEREVKLTPFKR